MKKESIYKIAIAVLIVLNLLQVVGRFMAHRPIEYPIKKAVQLLNLDASQEEEFIELSKAHRKEMVALQKKKNDLIEIYFNKPSDSILNEVTLVEKTKIQATEEHFSAIKTLLNKDQHDEFRKFKKKALNKIMRVQSKN